MSDTTEAGAARDAAPADGVAPFFMLVDDHTIVYFTDEWLSEYMAAG